ncbi:copper homeostasis protein CutC [Paenarthrobacter sp. NPDC089675]|uniref:copper homeostasis protein CutC n=1 Tax=Paenarthrobacter sp. NPDC089675 TaxID=3364376 RepID=UPI0038222A94
MELEIAVTSAVGAGTAASEGADRIELCSALELGGLTPSQGLLEAGLEHVDGRLGIHALVRCRPGDFRYSASEVDTMVHEVRHLLSLGADGIVLGALTPDGDVDSPVVQRLVDVARQTKADAQLTFHRAIDQSRDPLAVLDRLVEFGFHRVLTSGHEATAGEGLGMLARLVERSAGAIGIMAGGGLKLSDIPAMHSAGLSAVHLSAKRAVSTLAEGSVPLGSQDGVDPTAYEVTDRETVRAARAAVNAVNLERRGL